MKHIYLLVVVLLAVALAAGVLAEEAKKEDTKKEGSAKEDLSACKLPHAELVFPDRNSPKAKKGYFLRFSDQTLNPSPFKGEPRTVKEFFKRMRSERIGDLMYSSLEDGTFIAISGRATDLGRHFLHELSGRRLTRPNPVWSTPELADGKGTPGSIEGLRDGHCYLIETLDGKFALVRMVQKRGRLALIQYVYQPNGKLIFDIPKGKVTKVPPLLPKPAKYTPPRPVTVPGNVTDVASLLAVRQKMIAKLLGTVMKPAKTRQEIVTKVRAIKALGRLRAREAAGVLVQQIDFCNPNVAMRALNLIAFHPCVSALQSIGKPGSLAALAAIAKFRPVEGTGKEARLSGFRLRLLVMVIEDVEGADVAKFMIKAKMKQVPAGSRATLELALKNLRK